MFVRTLIITVLAALAAPSLAEESAAFGAQAQDAVTAASAVETGKEAATEEASEENEDGEDDGEEAALVEEDEEGEEDDGEEGDEDEDPFEEAAETFVSEGDTIPPSTNLMRTRKSHAKAAMQIDSGGDASSKEWKKSAAPDFAEQQQGNLLMRTLTSRKDVVQIGSGDTSIQVGQEEGDAFDHDSDKSQLELLLEDETEEKVGSQSSLGRCSQHSKRDCPTRSNCYWNRGKGVTKEGCHEKPGKRRGKGGFRIKFR